MLILGKTYNKYDIFILLLIATLVAGNFGGALQLPRIMSLIFTIPLLSCYNVFRINDSKVNKWLMCFLLYSAISITWSAAGFTEATIAFLYNVVHTILLIEIVTFSYYARNPVKTISVAFLIAFLISAIIAFWEITTDHHLAYSFAQEAKASNTGDEIYVRYFAAVTFGNLNTYVTFICFVLPFLFYGMASDKNSRITKYIFIFATVAAVLLVLYNGSRGGLIAVALMGILYYIKVPHQKTNFFSLFVFILSLGYILFKYGATILSTLIVKNSATSMYHDDSRMSIWSNVLRVINDYLGFGCGTGGLPYAMDVYVNGGINVAHNLFLEVASQYGLIFAFALVVFLIRVFKNRRALTNPYRNLCVTLIILSIPIIGIINSIYLTQPTLWAALASLYVYSNNKIRDERESVI